MWLNRGYQCRHLLTIVYNMLVIGCEQQKEKYSKIMAGLMEGQGIEIWRGQGYEDSRFELRDPISPSFHCPICMNVLNDPVMCRNNQHYFCRACITKHLTNTHNCPTCQDELTEDTLVQASRIVLEYLSELRIRCDFFNRGCRDVMKSCQYVWLCCSEVLQRRL